MGLEHQVEPAWRRQRTAVDRALQPEPLDDRLVAQLGRAEVLRTGQLIEPIAPVAGRALDERVLKRPDMAGGDPHLGVHQDPGVEPDHVVAQLDHRPPPRSLDVALQLDPERAVVPHGVDPAVDLGRGEDEATPLAERDDRVEVGNGGRDRLRIGGLGVGHDGGTPLGRSAVAGTSAGDVGRPMLADRPDGPSRRPDPGNRDGPG